MTSPAALSHAELLQLLAEKDQQLRERDMALQTKDLLIEQLTQERDEYKLAYDQWMQQRFRNRSERYLDNPDQLRLDLGDTPEAADAAQGLAEAVEEQELTIPEHKRRKRPVSVHHNRILAGPGCRCGGRAGGKVAGREVGRH